MVDVTELLVQSATSGLISGLATPMLFNISPDFELPTPIGNFGVPVAIGGTVFASQVVAELIGTYGLQDKEGWNQALHGFLNPALAAASTCILVAILSGGDVALSGYLKLSILAGGSTVISDYIYSHFLDSMLTM